MSLSLRLAILLFAALSLTACGGSSDNPPPAVADDRAEINAGNAEKIAGTVLRSAYQGGEFGSFIDLSGALGAGTTKPGNVYATLGKLQLDRTGELLKQSQIGLFQAPIDPVETACAVSGSTTLTGDIANTETLGVNDVLTIVFADCDDGLSVIDGTISMTITAFSGDFSGGSVEFSVAVEVTDFSITEDGASETANGDITISLDLPNTGPVSMTIAADNFSLADALGTSTLQDFALTQTIDSMTSSYSMTVSGRVGSSAFDGLVEFSTAATLTGTGEDFAATGELSITGADGATIAVFALDASMLRLEIDYGGDGIVDEVIDSTWEELLAA